MNFSDAITQWIDPDGMIGSCPHPPRWSSGNGILETAIAIRYCRALGEFDLVPHLTAAIIKCRAPNGSFYKNPGRKDQITHDDTKAAATVSYAIADDICACGMRQIFLGQWVISNDGSRYWDAVVKPWDQAIYLLCAGRDPGFVNERLLISSTCSTGNPSGDRLMWLCLNSIRGISKRVDQAHESWAEKMKYVYGTVGNLMAKYYEYETHPYAEFGNQLSF